MTKKARGRPGRKPLRQGKVKRDAFTVRTTSELRSKMEAAAARSGRSLSQEIDHRLEMSFVAGEIVTALSADSVLADKLLEVIKIKAALSEALAPADLWATIDAQKPRWDDQLFSRTMGSVADVLIGGIYPDDLDSLQPLLDLFDRPKDDGAVPSKTGDRPRMAPSPLGQALRERLKQDLLEQRAENEAAGLPPDQVPEMYPDAGEFAAMSALVARFEHRVDELKKVQDQEEATLAELKAKSSDKR